MRKYIKVNKIKFKDNFTVEYEIEHSEGLEYFNRNMYVKYDNNISNIPESILVIPLLSNLLPICWFLDINLYLKEIDKDFYLSLEKIKGGFQSVYNQINMGGHIYVEKVIENNYKRVNSALLFSGGVDSVSSYINNVKKNPLLVIVRGADISLEDSKAWKICTDVALDFSKNNNTKVIQIESNFKDFLKGKKIAKNFEEVIWHWWPCVQHGFGFCGLIAPISYTEGISDLYIASSFTEETNIPWGSDPRIENEIKWGETQVHHDNFNRNRQEKIKQISNYVNKTGNQIKLRVCWENPDGFNCCKCEKCSTTMIALMLENLDPKKFGFELNDKIYEHSKRCLTRGEWNFTHGGIDSWDYIKKNISDSEKREFFIWLKNYDLNLAVKKHHVFYNKLRKKIVKTLRTLK
ncbi:hypothetical protein [uncultured Ilyobacter sp.]|uniref:hypothetical protein n=1 Tax=uncultured Ilyobacter sp. TaxID=544433 RepID=UPI0029C6669D|nr:hypothetical protein [uncultured Ilyobacter sp.]